MKRTVLIAVPSVLALLVGGLLVAPSFIDWSQYRDPARAQIKAMTGYDAALNGRISVALLPTPRLFVEDVSIAAPEGSARDYLLKLKRFDAHLALAPLLSGRVEVTSVSLVEPQAALEILPDGRRNWMTPEIEKLTGGSAAGGQGAPVAFKEISIEKGAFEYRDSSKPDSAPAAIGDINITAEAQTMRGPFAAQGGFNYGGQDFTVKAATGAMDESQSIALNASGELKPAGVAFEYAGVVATAAPFSAQGETSLTINSLKDLTGGAANGGAFRAKGLLTANADMVDFKNAALALDDGKFSGDLSAALNPLKITGAFKAEDTVNLDGFIKGAGKGKAGGVSMLPQTITMPAPFDAAIEITAPGMVYGGQVYSGVRVALSKQGKAFAAGIAADGAPGKAKFDAKAALVFATKSRSKNGGETYAGPAATIALKARTQNLRQTAEAVTGGDMPALGAWKTAETEAKIEIKPDAIAIRDTVLKLDEDSFNVAGSYAGGARPKIVADVSASKIDFDALSARMNGGAPAPQKPVAESLKSLALPFDLDLDFGAQQARINGRSITGLRAQGSLHGAALTIQNLSAQDFAGGAAAISGAVGDLKALSGVDVKFSLNSKDIRVMAAATGVKISGLPDNFKEAQIDGTARGDSRIMAVSATINAIGGALTAKGNVAEPFGALKISDLEIDAKHPNTAQAIQALSGDTQRYASLEKPLDFHAKIDRAGNVYTLKDMRANVAGSPVTGNLIVDAGAAKPTARGDLSLDKLVIQTGGGAGGERWSSAPIDTGWMNAYEADFTIKANQFVYQGWDMQKPNLTVALHKGALKIDNAQAGLFGGQMTFNAVANANSNGKGYGAVSASADFKNVEAEGLVRALTGATVLKAQGDVSMKTSVETAGGSASALVGALKGDGTLGGKGLVLEGVDLAGLAAALSDENRPNETLEGLWKGVSKGGSTSFDTLDGAFTITRGVADITKMDLDGPKAKIATTGKADFPAWRIELANLITLKAQAGQNPQDVPPPFTVRVAGPLDNPAQTFAQGAINDYIQRKISRKLQSVIQKKVGGEAGGLIGNILGVPQQQAPAAAPETAPAAGDGAAEPPPAAPAPTKSDLRDEAIKGVLQGILGR